MERLRSIFVWKAKSGKFTWCVGASLEKVVSRMRTLYQDSSRIYQIIDFAEKLKGESDVSYIEQEDPKDCLHFDSSAKILQEQPIS